MDETTKARFDSVDACLNEDLARIARNDIRLNQMDGAFSAHIERHEERFNALAMAIEHAIKANLDILSRVETLEADVLRVAQALSTTPTPPPPRPSDEERWNLQTVPIVPQELIQALEVAAEALRVVDAGIVLADDIAGAQACAANALPKVRHALQTWRDRATREAGAEISDEEWYALKDRLWDQHVAVGDQGERFMWYGDFDTALDLARKELARWGGAALPVPAADKGEGQKDV
jgi:hypothetical protein